jgi:hypothetical protein
MALRNGQGQRKKYLTLELSSVRNLVEDMCAIVSEFQSAKIGDNRTFLPENLSPHAKKAHRNRAMKAKMTTHDVTTAYVAETATSTLWS